MSQAKLESIFHGWMAEMAMDNRTTNAHVAMELGLDDETTARMMVELETVATAYANVDGQPGAVARLAFSQGLVYARLAREFDEAQLDRTEKT